MTQALFPADFVWGVATSAYQIEGATAADGRGPSIWDTFCAVPGAVVRAANGSVACDHYARWRADLDLVAGLGANAYRFSIAWPRVQPSGRGPVNAVGLDFYERLVDGMLERGLAPYATLYHWDLPQALEDRGGWLARDTAHAFAEYAGHVADRLGDRVAAYATLNEPWCSAYLGYGVGVHAPGKVDQRDGLTAAHHLLLAHGLALPALRAAAPAARHGIVLNLFPTEPERDLPEDREAAVRHDGFMNRWYLDPLFRGRYPEDVWEGYGSAVPEVREGDLATIARPIDYLGVNYYSPAVVRDAPDAPYPHTAEEPFAAARTVMGWLVRPAGLTRLLVDLHAQYAPRALFVTENGAAYADESWRDGRPHDVDRRGYLEGHVLAVADAMALGAPVEGYFAWSLLDNFEWAEGYGKRFGIVHVDFETQVRTPKASAEWYARFVRAAREGRASPAGAGPI